MSRIASVNDFSPAGTVLAIGTTNSNSVKTESAEDLRAYLHITAMGVGATIDCYVMTSHDNLRWAEIGAFNQIAAIGEHVMPFRAEQIGTYTRLKYVVAGNTVTLQASAEKKA